MVELTDAQRAHLAADVRRRLRSCVPWNRKLKWAPELNIAAQTYPTVNLFAEVRPSARPVNELREGEYVDSGNGQFRYAVRLHRRGAPLETWWGRKIGTVVFDGDIEIPILFEREGEGRPFRTYPWMSLTPAELLTLRPGTKLAKGRVVIAGLGLAHQLIEVGKRRAVTQITVVERSRELVELIMPRAMAVLSDHAKSQGGGDIQVRILGGDAFSILPKLEADVALVDVFPAYGDNRAAMAELRKRCKGIGRMWDWGASELL